MKKDKLMLEVVEEFISIDVDSIVRMLEPIARSEKMLLKEAKEVVADYELQA